jgi:hypothetical protein
LLFRGRARRGALERRFFGAPGKIFWLGLCRISLKQGTFSATKRSAVALIINHNVLAMNASRNLGDHCGVLAVSTRRLPPGRRIGPAGLFFPLRQGVGMAGRQECLGLSLAVVCAG